MILKIELKNFFYKIPSGYIVITTLQITDLPEKDEENEAETATDHLTAEVWVDFC